MSRSFKVKHQWLRDALEDKKLTQRDVANLWGVNEAQVSRYINHGEPE
jgi:predicted transcriptional regulator